MSAESKLPKLHCEWPACKCDDWARAKCWSDGCSSDGQTRAKLERALMVRIIVKEVGARVNLQAGQEIWYVARSRHACPGPVKVSKVGRKWATLENGMRVDIATGQVDGGEYSSPGECYPDRETWERWTVTCQAWSEFRWLVERSYGVPKGATLSQIENARRSLFKSRADTSSESPHG